MHPLVDVKRATAVGMATLVLLMLSAQSAVAAGLFLAPPGVRPLAQGGAFVAGASGVDALAYNPAGIGMGKPQALIEAGLPLHHTLYRRQVYGDGATLPTVEGVGLGMPSPALGVVHGLGLLPGLTFGLGLFADYPLMQNWPEELDDGEPAPQRYAVYNYRGTAMMKGALAAAYHLDGYGSIGVSVQVLAGTFASEMTASICDGVICTQPENPDYDAVIQMSARDIVVPGVQLGIVGTPLPWLRLAASWESGYRVEQEAALRIRLPRASIFDNAGLDPQEPRGTVKLRLPMQLRAGVEVLREGLGRLELAWVYEPWSVHDRIEVDSRGTVVRGVTALGDYPMGVVQLERGFRDTFSLRLGGELLPGLKAAPGLVLRGGLAWEPSAVADEYLTAMTVDLDKLIAAVGAGYTVGVVTIDVTYAHVFFASTVVTDSKVLQINPTRPPWQGRTPIGNGAYAARADIFAMAVRVGL